MKQRFSPSVRVNRSHGEAAFFGAEGFDFHRQKIIFAKAFDFARSIRKYAQRCQTSI